MKLFDIKTKKSILGMATDSKGKSIFEYFSIEIKPLGYVILMGFVFVIVQWKKIKKSKWWFLK